jgi:hypothetical protein
MAGALRFYERAEVKDAVAYLRLLSNPADDEAFARIINVPRRNLGDAALNSVRIVAAETGTALLAAARAAAGTLGIARTASLVAFLDLLDDLLAYAQEHPGVARLLGRLYDRAALVPRRPATNAPTATGRTCCNCSALPPAMTPNTPTAERSATSLRRWRSLATPTAWRASTTR